ncbi:GNAT family N-acetyltransferase [Halorientalis marina]|jgi:ribosomal protein S18 acetylase RimI-like enzyme|uniref:GNAT family N-acetyltransferase n=1 Tax=Halorientalis marina TaxID=2931976 RepID=UPI001FF50C5E|nr:GNAT family N-acetyltransferase [Halorientalis marina]
MPIRAATTADVTAIKRVARASWRADYPDVLSRETAEEGVEEWYDDEQLAAEIERDDAVVLVARREDEVAGFVHAVVVEDRGTILRVYVHPDARGEGLGSQLLDRAERELRDRGANHVQAMVLADNEPGRAFYEGAGFTLEDEGETVIGGESYRECVYGMRADGG